MKALTVRQPWAWAIVWGGKDVENRSQLWTYRGLLAIHAGKTPDDGADSDPLLEAVAANSGVGTMAPVGAVIGVVDLFGCHWAANHTRRDWCSPWAQDDTTHLMLRNPRPLARPVEVRGMPGMFDLPDDVAAAVRRQLGGAQ